MFVRPGVRWIAMFSTVFMASIKKLIATAGAPHKVTVIWEHPPP